MGFIQWLKDRRECAERRKTAWKNIEQKEDNSLTVFQNQCNKKLLKVFEIKLDLINKQNIEGDTEKYIVGTLPNSDIKYYIYEDGAEIGGRSLERWGYETPEALIEDFISIATTNKNLTNHSTGSA